MSRITESRRDFLKTTTMTLGASLLLPKQASNQTQPAQPRTEQESGKADCTRTGGRGNHSSPAISREAVGRGDRLPRRKRVGKTDSTQRRIRVGIRQGKRKSRTSIQGHTCAAVHLRDCRR